MDYRYLNPKNDVAFKKIFGTEKNKDILIHFLNDLLHIFVVLLEFKDEHYIEIVKLFRSKQGQKFNLLKTTTGKSI